jgi:hypothetical protein
VTATSRALTSDEFWDELHRFDFTTFRIELQKSYLEEEERPLFEAFLRGDPPPPTAIPELKLWFEKTANHVAAGKTVTRVRVQEDEPTDYQRFERWIEAWNREAGERMLYLTRSQAHAVGLLPGVGVDDWWLQDSKRLIVMRFDEAGRRVENELVTDPVAVQTACAWRDLAVHHAARATARSAAA